LSRTPHDPARLLTYLRVHTDRMEAHLKEGFVQKSALVVQSFPGESICIKGHLSCKGEILISVIKRLVIVDGGSEKNPLVQTKSYSYNAFVAGWGTFLRHDNSHEREGHPDNHHYHEFDWRTEEELLSSPVWCGEKNWPNLSEFINKANDWYDRHVDELPNPEGVVLNLEPYACRIHDLVDQTP